MMSNQTIWLKNHLNNMEDGQYWHVPSDDLVYKVDKRNQKLSLINGDSGCYTAKTIEKLLMDIGYRLDGAIDYFCS